MGRSLLNIGRKKKQKPRTSFQAEQMMMGVEPILEDFPESQAEQIQIFNWYNYFGSQDTYLKYVAAYMKSTVYSIEDCAAVRREGKTVFSNVDATVARLHTREVKDIPKRLYNQLNSAIKEAIAQDTMKKVTIKVKPTISVHERMMDRVGELLGKIEVAIDKFPEEFDAYKFFNANDVAGKPAKMIADYYRPILEELKENGEGYDNITCEGLVEFVQDIVDDADKVSTMKKVARAPRAKTVQSVLKKVENVKYKRLDDNLKVASEDPSKIIGAYAVYVYNTKYKALILFVADSVEGLDISGTSVKGFDAELSQQRGIRKPGDIIPKVLECTRRSVKAGKPFEELTTNRFPAGSRLNEHSLILKVIK